MMNVPQQSNGRILSEMAPAQTALYTRDTLESLRKIALQQKQILLAHLLELAAIEAKSLGTGHNQDTRLPG
ncbi:MAG: hypothetical protein KGM97_03120 [Alphaproteobacteria bacterium]|nr:hypothetical protein [Alphaproteobacteria bacterium]